LDASHAAATPPARFLSCHGAWFAGRIYWSRHAPCVASSKTVSRVRRESD
jgi:hypothetical protein